MKERKRLWIPESGKIPIHHIELPPVRIGGYYYVYLIDAETSEVKRELEFPNLITDAGLDIIGNGTSLDTIYSTLVVGIGSAIPAVSDTVLENEIGSTTNSDGQSDVDGFEISPVEFAFRRRTRQFGQSEVNGNLRELGWTIDGVVANRTLFKDVNGNPTTVIKTDRDLLKIVYEYRVFAPLNDVTGTFTFTLSSASVAYTIRPQSVTRPNGWNSFLSSMGSNASEARVHESNAFTDRTVNNDPSPKTSEDSSSLSPYVDGTFFRDIEYSWGFTDANFGSQINLVTWSNWNTTGELTWQMHLSSSIEKNVNNRMVMGFRHRWTRK